MLEVNGMACTSVAILILAPLLEAILLEATNREIIVKHLGDYIPGRWQVET